LELAAERQDNIDYTASRLPGESVPPHGSGNDRVQGTMIIVLYPVPPVGFGVPVVNLCPLVTDHRRPSIIAGSLPHTHVRWTRE
jgi:hypothetical protein